MSRVNTARRSAQERRIRAAASKWLIELETAPSVEAIWPQFQAWLREDPEHKIVYLRMERAWHALDVLRYSCPGEGSREGPALLDTHYGRLRRGLRWALVMVVLGASLIAVLNLT